MMRVRRFKRTKIFYLAIILVILDVSTIAVVGEQCAAKYVNASQKTEIVKLDEWGVTLTKSVDKIDRYSNGVAVTFTPEEYCLTSPGDSGGTSFALTGTPNANIALTYETVVTVPEPTRWKVDNKGLYFPVSFTVNNDKENTITLSEDQTKYTLQTTKSRLTRGTSYDTSYSVDWSWDYEKDDEYDAYDTALGNAAVNNDVEFIIQSTVTMEWDDGIYPAPEPDDDVTYDDPTPEDITVLSDEGTSTAYLSGTTDNAITADRTLSGANAIEPGRTLSGDATDGSEITPGLTLSGSVSTGDTFNLAVWISALIISTIVIIALLIFSIKRNKEENQGKEG
jgi:hypothetical protein